MVKTVVLFDLDGVLIKSGGYRAAFRAAMNYFLGQMGLDPEFGPKEHDLVTFESYGVTAEWDMLPVSLAILFEHFCSQLNGEFQLFDLKQGLEWAVTSKPANASGMTEGTSPTTKIRAEGLFASRSLIACRSMSSVTSEGQKTYRSLPAGNRSSAYSTVCPRF